MKRELSLLIVPVNDPEAAMIAELGTRLGMEVLRSSQPHGARLENEIGIVDFVRENKSETVIIVEIPGPAIEDEIRALGKNLKIIDHHAYTDLDRAHDASNGELLQSSLEQFLSFAEVDDDQLRKLGYDPRMVKAIGLWDKNFFWELIETGYSKEEIKKFLAFSSQVSRTAGIEAEDDEQTKLAAKRAWDGRIEFEGFQIIFSENPKLQIRGAISMLAALEYWKQTPMIIIEKNGKLIYVQETDIARELFNKFGGFTFGMDRCWGYDNEVEGKKVNLEDIKRFIKYGD